MKTSMILTCLLAAFILAFSAPAAALDAPHNAAVNIGCTDCHQTHFTPGTNTDDLCLSCHTNATGGGYTKNSAPKMLTHSSQNTSGKYGAWSAACVACHDPHTQEQLSVYGPAAYLVTGTIVSVADNGDGTTTFGYTNPVEYLAGWGDWTKWGKKSSGNASGGNERGLILFPNTADPAVSFEISSATATAMTIKGSMNTAFPGRVTPGNTFVLAYGQLVNAGIVGAGTTTRTVRFFRNSSNNSFGYNDAASGAPDSMPDGVCQACHTQTRFWRFDGAAADHYSGANCTICHRHEEGFKPSCDNCHNSPPATGTHVPHFDAGVADYGTTSIQSTPAAYAFSCGTCHSGTHLNTATNPRTVEVRFAGVATQDGATGAVYTASTYTVDDPGTGYTFDYSDGTCANVYCHGNYPGSGKNASVTFNTGTAPCGSCHGASNAAVPASGSHSQHAATSRYNFRCTLCHAAEVGGSGPSSYSISDKQKHVSGNVDWAFDTADPRVSAASNYRIAPGTAVPSDGLSPRPYGTCGNVYCHSNVQPDGGVGGPSFYAAPRWGDRYAAPCGSCHEGGHGLNISSGSHPKHLEYDFLTTLDRYKCTVCHKQNPAGELNSCSGCHAVGVLPPFSVHPNYKVDVVFDSLFGSGIYYGTPAPGDGYSNCANTYCHSDGTSVATARIPVNATPNWGNGTLPCSSCHGNPPAYASGSPKANSHVPHSGERCSACHVVTTADGAAIMDKSAHVNRVYNVNPDTAAGVAFTYAFSSRGGTCSGISCHGGNAATWGGPSLKCSNCHSGPRDVDDFVFGNSIIAMESSSQWVSTGHGRPSPAGNYPQSGNPAANFDGAAGSGDSCLYCHDNTVSHNTPTNTFRLRNTAGPEGQNGNCQKCHKPGSTGYVSGVDGPLPSKNASAATKMADYHWLTALGGKHSAARNGGYFCWDCHDPHGDMNVAMVHDALSKRNDWNGTGGYGIPAVTGGTSFTTMNTWGSYVNSGGTGVCQVCHEITSRFTGTSNYDAGHNPGMSCTASGCHTHLGSPVVNGDAFPGAESGGGARCGACHSDLSQKMSSTGSTKYHHLMKSDTPAYTSGECLECHVDHNIFRQDINTANTIGRAANLRTNINTAVPAPPTTTGYTNADFLPTDTDGGICLSCHKSAQSKGYPQPDGTTKTPAIPYAGAGKAVYQASAHRYTVTSTFGRDGSTFNADCSKCHNDDLSPKSSFAAQSSANKFGNHESGLRRTLAALGIAAPADPLEEKFCYQCHSGAVAGNDYYGVQAMTAQSRRLQAVFGKAYRHDIAAYTGTHKPYPEDDVRWSTNRHVECDDCHNAHAAQAGTHAPATQWYPTSPSATTNNVSGVLQGVPGVQPTTWPSIWTVAMTFTKLDAAAREYQICFRCHSYNGLQDSDGVTAYTTLSGAIVTDQALEYNPNNKSAHPVVVTANNQTGSYAPKALASGQLASPWITNRGNQTMYCSDCHGTDAENAGDPKGPHGASKKFMLKGQKTMWPMGTNKLFSLNDISGRNQEGGTLNTDWSTTLFCLNCHPMISSRSSEYWANEVHRIHDNEDYAPGGVRKNVYCIACHPVVPHGNKVSRLIVYRNQPAPYTYWSGGINFAALSGYKKASGPFNYSKGNCFSTVNGCHAHDEHITNPD